MLFFFVHVVGERCMALRFFTQAIFIVANRCNFVAAKLQQVSNVRNPSDVTATNCTKNRTWFTHVILKLQLMLDKNCIELPRQKSAVADIMNKVY